MIDGVIYTPLSIIDTIGGNVLHAMKSSDPGYFGFGESYFSIIKSNSIKGWKLHNEMVLNLVVPVGSVRFVIYDSREDSETEGKFNDIVLSPERYGRLTIPPKLWLGFQGIDVHNSLILNIASIPHDPNESISMEINEIDYDWN